MSGVFDILNADHSIFLSDFHPNSVASGRQRRVCNCSGYLNYLRQNEAATIIQRFFKATQNRRIFQNIKRIISYASSKDLATNNGRIQYKLNGLNFPPTVINKIEDNETIYYNTHFTYEHKLEKILNICDTFLMSEKRAAEIICNFMSRVRNRRIFHRLRKKMHKLKRQNPYKLLAITDNIYVTIYDCNINSIAFRLAGATFPPQIVYCIVLKPLILNFDDNLCGFCDSFNRRRQRSVWFVYEINKYADKIKTKKHKKFISCKKKRPMKISWIKEMYKLQ